MYRNLIDIKFVVNVVFQVSSAALFYFILFLRCLYIMSASIVIVITKTCSCNIQRFLKVVKNGNFQ